MKTRLRHVRCYDGIEFDLQKKRVLVDGQGHPIVWVVEHDKDVKPPRKSFWVTYLEAVEEFDSEKVGYKWDDEKKVWVRL